MFSRAPIVVLAAAALAGIWLGAATGDSSSPASLAPGDCRSLNPPTATGTPTPSPPWTPVEYRSICNDTSTGASDLHIRLAHQLANEAVVTGNPSGCADPVYAYDPGSGNEYPEIDISWQSACVDVGEAVDLTLIANCTTPEPSCGIAHVLCFYWTLAGRPLPSASPAYNPLRCQVETPTPAPPCDPRPTPPVTREPTPKPVAPTLTPGPTERDIIYSAVVTFCNNAGETATDLHIHMDDPYSFLEIEDLPDNCPDPLLRPSDASLDEFELHLDWRMECVRPNDTVVIKLKLACNGACPPPEPYCYTWTKWGEQLDSEGACLPPVERVWGDFACNGDVNALDVLRIFQHLAGAGSARPDCPKINEPLISNGEHVRWGDATCNSILDESDAVLLLRHIAQLVAQPNSFVCGGFGLTVKISPY